MFAAIFCVAFSTLDAAAQKDGEFADLIEFCDALRDTKPEARRGLVEEKSEANSKELAKEFRSWLSLRGQINNLGEAEQRDQWTGYVELLDQRNSGASAALVRLPNSTETKVFVEWSDEEISDPKPWKTAANCLAFSFDWNDLDSQQSWYLGLGEINQTKRSIHDSQTATAVRTNRDLALGALNGSHASDKVRAGSERKNANASESITWIEISLYPNAVTN